MENKIPLFKVFMSQNSAPEVSKVLNSGYIGQGPKVEEFEKSLKKFFNNDYVTTLNSGTSGLHLALHLLKRPSKNTKVFDGVASSESFWPGLETGDEVLATPMTCTASNWPILANGLSIKWVDVDPSTMNMDLDDLARKITAKTKVIMLVHWGGYPNDLAKLQIIQHQAFLRFGFKPVIIEDGAHSFGSMYNGRMIGNHGNLTVFSLQAIKHITSIDGGILISPHRDLNERAKLVRWYGIDREGDRKDFRCEANIEEWGFKFHMNDVCATVGIENLKHANEIIGLHRENAKFYDENLGNVSGLKLLKREAGFDSAFWIYSMLVDNREGFYRYMDECGITVSQVHERNDKHTCVSEYSTSLPSLDKTIGKLVSIPVGWWIDQEKSEYIADCIKKGW
jgi:dTDP-4-amino-4,6-dideoxy-D-glucose/dTDP-4-amino-2,4-dideoxy-beta-L-xylose transaminase